MTVTTRRIYHQLTIHTSHDFEGDFRSVCRNVNVNNNSSFENYTNPDDHTRRTFDTPVSKYLQNRTCFYSLPVFGQLFSVNNFAFVNQRNKHF